MQGILRDLGDGRHSSAAAITIPSETKPDVQSLVDELREAINHSDVWQKRLQLAEDSTWCMWPGQSDSGLKESDGQDDDTPFPWENASDTRIHLVDEAVRRTCRVCNAAFQRGKWKVAGTEMKDRDWAQRAQVVLKWLIFTQMRPMAQRERKLALYWRQTLGVSFTLVEWEENTALQLTDLDMAGILEAFGLGAIVDYLQERQETVAQFLQRIEMQGGAPEELQAYEELSNALDLVRNDERTEEFLDTLKQLFPTVRRNKLRDAVNELRATGATRLPQPYVLRSRPVWRALKPFRDGFLPINTVSVEDARWFAVRDWYSEADLKEKILTEGWDKKAVQQIIKHGEGMDSTEYIEKDVRSNSKRYVSGRGSWESAAKQRTGLFEVFTWYYWTVDDYGVRGLYKTIASAAILPKENTNERTPSWCWHGLADLDHGELPVVEHVFFRDTEVLMESVGLAYLLYTYQNEVKTQRDARIDHTSISILPPVRRHLRDQNTPLVIQPGTPIHEALRGTTEWMTPPENRTLQSVEIENAVKEDVDRLSGGMNQEIPAPEVQLHQQQMANDYLDECVELLSMTFKTAQQYLPESTVTRVVGPNQGAFKVSADDIRGEFDLRIVFDARDLDTEYAEKKAENAVKLLALDDKGVFEKMEALPDLMGLISYEWAEAWTKDPKEAAQEEIEEEMQNLSMILNGLEPPMRQDGQNFELRRQVLMSQVQGERANPEVISTLQESEQKLKIFQTRLQHLDFAAKQHTVHARAGMMGAKPVLGG